MTTVLPLLARQGYEPEYGARPLRRAIGMAYNTDEETRVVWQGQAIPATQFLPPHVFGFDPAKSQAMYLEAYQVILKAMQERKQKIVKGLTDRGQETARENRGFHERESHGVNTQLVHLDDVWSIHRAQSLELDTRPVPPRKLLPKWRQLWWHQEMRLPH